MRYGGLTSFVSLTGQDTFQDSMTLLCGRKCLLQPFPPVGRFPPRCFSVGAERHGLCQKSAGQFPQLRWRALGRRVLGHGPVYFFALRRASSSLSFASADAV
jgi:hypothetical protein